MAKVPDLGSDFAQKLLRDLRRRRERLGFESSATPAKGAAPSVAAPRARGKLPSSPTAAGARFQLALRSPLRSVLVLFSISRKKSERHCALFLISFSDVCSHQDKFTVNLHLFLRRTKGGQ